jgi:hypothetical protein
MVDRVKASRVQELMFEGFQGTELAGLVISETSGELDDALLSFERKGKLFRRSGGRRGNLKCKTHCGMIRNPRKLRDRVPCTWCYLQEGDL